MKKKCPGGKIRSKGRGKGLGRSNKQGPRGVPSKSIRRGLGTRRGKNAI